MTATDQASVRSLDVAADDARLITKTHFVDLYHSFGTNLVEEFSEKGIARHVVLPLSFQNIVRRYGAGGGCLLGRLVRRFLQYFCLLTFELFLRNDMVVQQLL